MEDTISSSLSKLSFRDPAGALYALDGRMIRVVKPGSVPQLKATLASTVCQDLLSKQSLPATRLIGVADVEQLFRRLAPQHPIPAAEMGACVEHERIAFPSFPHEWCPEMLWRAAEITLDIAQALSPEGMGLKDATPYNVLFKGPNAIFVDILSIERRTPGDSLWVPFGQFVRTFLTPLLANRHLGLPLDMVFLAKRDGLEPESLYPLTHPLQRLRQPFFSLVTMPYWLSRLGGRGKSLPREVKSGLSSYEVDRAKYVYESLLTHLRRLLKQVKPLPERKSRWTTYMEETLPYTKDQFAVKAEYVRRIFQECKPRKVLDVGCNTGFFSQMAAEAGASVVAIDSDEVAVDRVWRQARESKQDILPLVVNLNRPSPALGWENRETTGFLERSKGQFDLVCMLAVLHHIVHGDGIALPDVMRLVAGITREYALIEFMEPTDPSVQAIANRRTYMQAISRGWFEKTASQYFEIVHQQEIPKGTRTLYLMRKR
jgi:2-polyprenyl-3-methyl-5-hydroxy-6-metoxy-1,4-benzoquinol methylase